MPEEKSVSITPGALAEIVKTAIEEARKPYVDPAEIARKKDEHDQMVENARLRNEREQRRKDACQHKRRSPIGVLAYKIAWQQNSDGKFRGTCQICGEQFTPERTKADRYRQLIQESLDPTVCAYAVQLT